MYRLTADVENPKPDRRVKNSSPSFVTWKKGTIWKLVPAHKTSVATLEMRGTYGRLMNHQDEYGEQFAAVMDKLEQVPHCDTALGLGVDARDHLHARIMDLNCGDSLDILRALWFQGKINDGDIVQVMEWFDELSEETVERYFQ
jgi:hypothetical protein